MILHKEEVISIIDKLNFWKTKQETGIIRTSYLNELIKREKMKEIIAIVGVRRSGKSTLTKQYLNYKITKGIDKTQTLYINFEEPAFTPYLNLELLDIIYEAYREIINNNKLAFIVLDEIQNIPGWEKWVRMKQENFKDIKIIVTGSSSKLLSSEFSTVLSGRSIPFNIFPLSFKEFINFKKKKIKKIKDTFLEKDKIKILLREYLKFGGFPRIVLENKENKILLLKEYFEAIILRDIASRYSIREINVLKALATFLLTNNASLISIGKLANLIRASFKVKTSLETISKFLHYFESAFLISLVPIFSYKIKDQLQYPRKIYCIDTGLRNIVSFKFSKDIGKLYETVVFWDLKRKEKEIYYWKNSKGKEVDFVIKQGMKVKELIQVCYDIKNEKTKKREINGLILAMKEFKLKQGLIITEDYEAEEKIKNKKIKYIPLWKWLLNTK